MKRQLMAEQWDEYARRVLPPNCHPTQKKETRRAFYAGAQCILFRVIEGLTSDADPTDADLVIMQGVHDELQEFAKLVTEGRA